MSAMSTDGAEIVTTERVLHGMPRLSVMLFSFLALVVFAAYAIQILNLFYFAGAYSYDAGWFAYMVSRFEMPPANPLYIQDRDIPSFFAFHFSPIMPLWGAFAQLAGLSPPIAFAAYQGFFHALLALVGAGLASTRLAEPWNLMFRLFVGFALAFSPIALSAITFPHHELAIPILFIATCYALSRGRPALAALSFLLMLLVRTDSGFHAFCFLVAFAAGELIMERRFSPAQFSPAVKRALIYAGVAFAYSCAAFLIVYGLFPEHNNFRRNYSGPGFYDHFSLPFLQERMAILFEKRPELFVILGFTAAFGVIKRDLSILLGAFAVLPWVLLHVSGYRATPGELFTYYAFPFLILLAWPLLVPALRQVGERDVTSLRYVLTNGVAAGWIGMCVVAWLAYFFTPFADRSIAVERRVSVTDFRPHGDLKSARKVVEFSKKLSQSIGSLEGTFILMDEPLISLLPDTKRENLWREGRGEMPIAEQPFIVAYFSTYMHANTLERSYYGRAADACYSVLGTNIRILARASSDLVGSAFGDATEPLDCNRIGQR